MAFLRQLREQNDRFAQEQQTRGDGDTTAVSAWPGLSTRQTSHMISPATSEPARPLPARPLESAKKPLPVPPPKPVSLSKRALPTPGPLQPAQPSAGVSALPRQQNPEPMATGASAETLDWSAVHANAQQYFPEIEVNHGLDRLDLQEEPPSISIAREEATESAQSTIPIFNFSGSDEEELVHPPLIKVLPRSSRSVEDSSLVCAACSEIIAGKILNAMSQRYHPSCFRCAKCQTGLEHVAFHEREGRAYCSFDFHELFTVRCDHCKTPIVDESYVTIDDPELGERKFHELHFFCASCGDPFIDPKSLARPTSTSAASNRSSAQRSEPKPFVVHKGHCYCEACHFRLRAPKCASCGRGIAGDVLKALGRQWHDECFVCAGCQKSFSGSTFFVRDDKAWCQLCQKDYLRRQV